MVPIVSAETQVMCMDIFYAEVLVPTILYVVTVETSMVTVIYHMRIRKIEFCILASPDIWWQPV